MERARMTPVKRMNNIKSIILILSALGLTGCFYSLNPRGSVTIKSVAVERFQNDTPEFGLADQMTDAVINAFIADGTLKVLPRDRAEAVLSGTLTRYQRRPYEYNEKDQVKSYAVEMDFDIQLKKPSDDSLIWQEKMSQRGFYSLETEAEEDGRRKAIVLLVQAIINRTTKSW